MRIRFNSYLHQYWKRCFSLLVDCAVVVSMASSGSKSVLGVLFRSALRRAQVLERELKRAEILRTREVEQISSVLEQYAGFSDEKLYPNSTNIVSIIRATSRALASEVAEDKQAHIQVADTGFAIIKHLGNRAAALEKLVYLPKSEKITGGVKVEVESAFSGYERSHYLYKYHIKISNESDSVVTLLSRRWHIRDLDGRQSCVEGPGVVGAFPTLEPQESYSYSSAVTLLAPMGTQHGTYTFKRSDSLLEVEIAPFALTPYYSDGESRDVAQVLLRQSTRTKKRGRRSKGDMKA